MHVRLTHLVLILVILISVLVTGCLPGVTTTPTPIAEPVILRIAVLPILETLPIYVAQYKGYFATQGVKVEFIPVSSAAERDQIIAAGQADGMINDLVSSLLYNQSTIQIQVVRFARVATPEFPQYRILAAPNSGITKVEDLKGVEIGISEGSVIAYTTDRLLQAEGLSSADIKTIAVPKIPDRLALLSSGQIKAANLPDPLAFLAIQAGAVVVIDDASHPEYGNSLYSFRKSVVEQYPKAIRGFLVAIEQAINDINASPTQWDTFLIEQKLVPAPLIGTYQIPTFPSASIPSVAQWADVLVWAQEKGLITGDVSYEDSVTSDFLPK